MTMILAFSTVPKLGSSSSSFFSRAPLNSLSLNHFGGCVKPLRGYKLSQPGFIHGRRRVDGFEIPVDFNGEPGKRILNAVETLTKSFSSLSASNLLLAPPVNVDDLALAVVNAVIYDDFFCVFIIEQIKEAAAKVKV